MNNSTGLRWVHDYRDRHGQVRHYIRKKGFPTLPVSGRPGTAEFSLSYAQQLATWGNVETEPEPFGHLPHGPHVYFVRAGDFIKIGRSVRSKVRMKELSTRSPHRLEVILTLPGGTDLESRLHRRFATIRAAGEWFHAVPSLLDFVEEQRTKRERQMANQNQVAENRVG